MSNFCSLQFRICFLQNLHGALDLTPYCTPKSSLNCHISEFRWKYSDDISLTYRQGMISAAPCGKGGYLHLLSFSCRRVLWPINMVIPPTHDAGTERESYGPSASEYSACEIRPPPMTRGGRESGYSPLYSPLHSREMTPFPAAIIADFTLGKGKRGRADSGVASPQ